MLLVKSFTACSGMQYIAWVYEHGCATILTVCTTTIDASSTAPRHFGSEAKKERTPDLSPFTLNVSERTHKGTPLISERFHIRTYINRNSVHILYVCMYVCVYNINIIIPLLQI